MSADSAARWIAYRLKRYYEREVAMLHAEVWREANSREWWKAEAHGTGTDWSSLLRQRIRVLAWVRAGRPPIATWLASFKADGIKD